MKINIFINDYFVNYNKYKPKELQQMSLKHFKRAIQSDEHLYILRGEPTLHKNFFEILTALEGKQYILTTHGHEYKTLLRWKKSIPYLVLKWDGFLNDEFKNNPKLTYNIMKLLHIFNERDTILRIEYIINNQNLKWYKADIAIIQKLYEEYVMKKPYFVLYQKSKIFNEEKYHWIPFGMDHLVYFNKSGLLDKKTIQWMQSFISKETYFCSAIENELVVHADGTVRPCMSVQFPHILGSIEDNSLDDIITVSEKQRKDLKECPNRKNCWLTYHFRNNIDTMGRIFNVK